LQVLERKILVDDFGFLAKLGKILFINIWVVSRLGAHDEEGVFNALEILE